MSHPDLSKPAVLGSSYIQSPWVQAMVAQDPKEMLE